MTIGAALTLVQPQAVWALESREVNEIAKEITVRISGGDNGTGVIIARKRKGDHYYMYVLTAHHVVLRQNDYKIKTPDKEEYGVDYSKIRRLPAVDLALLEFTSTTKYKVAKIGDSDRLTEASAVYTAGWPVPGSAITERIYQFTEGKISALRSSSLEGYTLVYTNNTRAGMSGGPVLNELGQVIGIHGKAEGERLSGGQVLKAGFNLGIPIQTFIDSIYGNGLRIGKRNNNYHPPHIYTSPRMNSAIGQGGYEGESQTEGQAPDRTSRTPRIDPPTNDNRFPSHIVLNNQSQPFVPNDIDRIDSVLIHKDLQPAACNQSADDLVRIRMGPYKVCAYPNPGTKYRAATEHEFPFWR